MIVNNTNVNNTEPVNEEASENLREEGSKINQEEAF
jgi:hypothetical protein